MPANMRIKEEDLPYIELSEADQKRRSQGILTTLEMDGYYTKDDIANKKYMMLRCDCGEWSKVMYGGFSAIYDDCQHCDEARFDMTSMQSVRTYDPILNKKKRRKR